MLFLPPIDDEAGLTVLAIASQPGVHCVETECVDALFDSTYVRLFCEHEAVSRLRAGVSLLVLLTTDRVIHCSGERLELFTKLAKERQAGGWDLHVSKVSRLSTIA